MCITTHKLAIDTFRTSGCQLYHCTLLTDTITYSTEEGSCYRGVGSGEGLQAKGREGCKWYDYAVANLYMRQFKLQSIENSYL